ncbi:hypothetical protein DU490_10645 [Halomonas sp. DQ26W]|nr:hypothetical protein DU490_10645 [Halomonas sp. DQ26W]
MKQKGWAPSMDSVAVGALVPIATGAGGRPGGRHRGMKKQLLERWFPSRLAPSGALAEAETLAVVAGIGNTAGSPSASSRDLKILQQRRGAVGGEDRCRSAALHRDWRRQAPRRRPPWHEKAAVGALVPIATGAGRRPGGRHRGMKKQLLERCSASRLAPAGAPAEATALAVIANMGNTAGRLAPPVAS